MPGDAAGTNTMPNRPSPSEPSITVTLAVSRFIDRERLHGFLLPLTTTPCGTFFACIVGRRIPRPLTPSANPEANSSLCWAMACSSSHSRPCPAEHMAIRVAAEKWCMVVATASEGARLPMARWTRKACTASAPSPPYFCGIRRPGPPRFRKRPIDSLSGCSALRSPMPCSFSSSPGRKSFRAWRSAAKNFICAGAPSGRHHELRPKQTLQNRSNIVAQHRFNHGLDDFGEGGHANIEIGCELYRAAGFGVAQDPRARETLDVARKAFKPDGGRAAVEGILLRPGGYALAESHGPGGKHRAVICSGDGQTQDRIRIFRILLHVAQERKNIAGGPSS